MPYERAWRSTPRLLLGWIDFAERVRLQDFALLAEMVFVGSQGDKKSIGRLTKQMRDLL